ncbi:hypothetical protein [Erythrobacter sp. NAP1]|uniref:hypothetical protein n=1 Tax=Erythrobacter sp. NAP1 TaxID=237727 RepID=UPI0002EE769E|nr:hypothetical protein [Erythrobacter sp. NAP1]
MIRFPSQADFLIEVKSGDGGEFRITGWPTPQCDAKTTLNLYHNAIQPILGNHSGGLFLHGSAVCARVEHHSDGEEGAVAFLGLSRSGKTTLAGSFAQAGHPFLTEDVIDLARSDGRYLLQPKRSKLRLFADSARHLLGRDTEFENDDIKQDVDAGAGLPFADGAKPLRQIYVLGTDLRADLSIRQFSLQEALSVLLPNAFILDVEDKASLRGHFGRLADLSQDIPCYALDFMRDYSELPRVRKAVLGNLANG